MHPRDNRIAVLGTGRMGARIVRRLLAAGMRVSTWNRTRTKADELRSDGAKVCETPAAAVRDASVVVICVRDSEAVTEILFDLGTAEAMQPGSLVIDTSSIQPQRARQNAQRLARRDIGYVDAPMTGGTTGAEAGTLLIMVGGRATDIERAEHVIDILGRMVVIGESGAGQVAKLAQQILMGATAAGLAEALVLAEQSDVDPDRVIEAIRGGLVHSRALELYARRTLSRDFVHRGAPASLQFKDLESVLAEAELAQVEFPLSRLLLDLYGRLLADFGEDLDKSAVYLTLASGSTPKAKKGRRRGGMSGSGGR